MTTLYMRSHLLSAYIPSERIANKSNNIQFQCDGWWRTDRLMRDRQADGPSPFHAAFVFLHLPDSCISFETAVSTCMEQHAQN